MRNCVQAPSINWAEAQRSRAGPGGYSRRDLCASALPALSCRAPGRRAAQAAAERRRQSDLVQVRALRHTPLSPACVEPDKSGSGTRALPSA